MSIQIRVKRDVTLDNVLRPKGMLLEVHPHLLEEFPEDLEGVTHLPEKPVKSNKEEAELKKVAPPSNVAKKYKNRMYKPKGTI